jgi:hypothetical protein
MQFVIGMTVLERYFVKHSHNPLGINMWKSKVHMAHALLIEAMFYIDFV